MYSSLVKIQIDLSQGVFYAKYDTVTIAYKSYKKQITLKVAF